MKLASIRNKEGCGAWKRTMIFHQGPALIDFNINST